MDRPDFADALRPHYDDALRYCHALTARAHHSEAEDLLQDALLKGLRKYSQLKDPSRFRSWMFSIITRLHQTAARRTLWRRFSPLTERETHIPDVYRGYELTPERLRLLRALSRLPEKERAALLLFEVAGFSHEEIRTIQGDRSLSAVKSRLSRTRARIRSILDEDAVGGNAGPAINPIQSLEKETLRATGDALKILKKIG